MGRPEALPTRKILIEINKIKDMPVNVQDTLFFLVLSLDYNGIPEFEPFRKPWIYLLLQGTCRDKIMQSLLISYILEN